ncbi:hypothetical protein BDN72DRAFT_847291 [Pluteus cervinus]|uniref:Uncharacterized protein n=1 Tax=Pluteus cervinus TaxID=181527 RepID=A0ACD3ADS9_9AGAR|nr:hypothetical protein BDN72DRAFT_847291 [Pluteus cervinus]
MTTLLRGLPRFAYHPYLDHLDDFPPIRDDETVDLSRLLCLLVRSREVVATIPIAATGGKFDLIVCWHDGADGSVHSGHGRNDSKFEFSKPEGELVYPTSDQAVKEMFLANRESAWEPHANRVFHLTKMAKPTNYEWLARYLLLANAENSLNMLKHPLRWAEVFDQLTFDDFDYDELEAEGDFPYPSGIGLRRLLSDADIAPIRNLMRTVEEDKTFLGLLPSTLRIGDQSLKAFLDSQSKSESSLALDKALMKEILVATHKVFQSSLEVLSSAYDQVVTDTDLVLDEPYEHITTINFAFHSLLQSEFLGWVVTTISRMEISNIHVNLMDAHEEDLLRVDTEQGPQIVGEPPDKEKPRWDEFWAWLHSCFNIIYHLEEVIENRKLSVVNELKFFNFSPAELSSAMCGSTEMPNWRDVIARLETVHSKEALYFGESEPPTREEFEEFLQSQAAEIVFEGVNQEALVVSPELHFEAFLATLHFATVVGLEVEKASDDPRLKGILQLFKRSVSRPTIGTSKPCCFTCREIILGLSMALRNHQSPGISVSWSHIIGSSCTFPAILPENVRRIVLQEVGRQFFRVLNAAVVFANL